MNQIGKTIQSVSDRTCDDWTPAAIAASATELSDAFTQMETAERDVHFAIVKYQLYLKHGLGVFDNWYTWKKDKLIRSEVVESLTYPVVRKNAESEIRRLKNQIKELEELMAEALDEATESKGN